MSSPPASHNDPLVLKYGILEMQVGLPETLGGFFEDYLYGGSHDKIPFGQLKHSFQMVVILNLDLFADVVNAHLQIRLPAGAL